MKVRVLEFVEELFPIILIVFMVWLFTSNYLF